MFLSFIKRELPLGPRGCRYCKIYGAKTGQNGPDVPDVLLHETAVSWMRQRLYATAPKRRWEETPEQLATRLQAAVAHCNDEYNVSGLCRKFTSRLTELVKETAGDRLRT